MLLNSMLMTMIWMIGDCKMIENCPDWVIGVHIFQLLFSNRGLYICEL